MLRHLAVIPRPRIVSRPFCLTSKKVRTPSAVPGSYFLPPSLQHLLLLLQAWLQCSGNVGCSSTPGSQETPPDMFSSTSILSTGSQPFHVVLREPECTTLAVAAAAKSLQSCLTLRPHRRQPTRLRHPWDSPGKNTGVGCHFLLQCMKVKVKSLSHV